jgi:tetratricopeptide (TPR) repeat protein
MLWVAFLMVAVSPWPFGCVHPLFELFLSYFIVAIAVFWCGMLIWSERLLEFSLRQAGIPWLFFVALTIIVAIPLLPFPKSWTDTLSPSVDAWTEKTTPSDRERLAAVAENGKSQQFGDASATQRNPEPMALTTGDRAIASEPLTPEPSPRGSADLDSSFDQQADNQQEIIEPPSSVLLSGGLTLNPAGNLQLFFRLGALSLLFLALSSIGRPEAAMRELAWVATVVGSVLALVAMLQSISPGSNQIYWFFDSKGSEFGPFLNKNHYPFFANLAIGLTIGILLERFSACRLSWAMLFRDGAALWILASLSLQLTSLAMSLSRGGVVSLVIAFVVIMILRAKRSPGAPILFATLFFGAITVVMMSWAGFNLLESRLVTLAEAGTYREDGRWYLWRVAASVFTEFPLFGSGGETYRHWQTIIQFGGSWNSSATFAHRADNEYLDVLCEHGIFALIALLALIVSLVISSGKQARTDKRSDERHSGERLGSSGLIAGGLISLLSVVIHSFVDFGLRVPASAGFAVVIAALTNAARPTAISLTKLQSTQPRSIRWLWPMMSIGVIVAVFAFLNSFVQHRQRYANSESHRLEAYAALAKKDTDRVIVEIESMVQATPEDVLAHLEYARIALLATKFASPPIASVLKREMVRHCVQLRDLCPLVWESPFWISQNIDQLASGDSVDYLRIANMLHPSNSTISYLLGVELFDRSIDLEMAMDAWKGSLLYSPRYLKEILGRALTKFTPQEVLDRILPANAATVVSAAAMLESLGQAESKNEFLRRAALEIDQSLPIIKPSELHTAYSQAADIQSKLGNRELAVDFIRKAISVAPTQIEFRFQLVGYLIDSRRLEEAKLELNRIQSLAPTNQQILPLRTRIFELEHPRVDK